MKKILILPLLLLVITSCSKQELKTAKVSFVFPQVNESSVEKNRYLASREKAQANGHWSGQITIAGEIDCFGVYIGGQEEENKRNYCNEKATGQPLMNFGRYFSAIASGEKIEIELESEVLRQLTIVGMGSYNGECIVFDGFSPPAGFYSHPRILHQEEYVFSPGTQEIPVLINGTFDASNREIDNCEFDSPDEPPGTVPVATPALLSFAIAGSYDFGSQSTGSSTSTTFTLTNSGAEDATALAASGLIAPMLFAGGAYPGTGGTCGATLLAGASCTVAVEYSPTVTGSTSQTLAMQYNDGAAVQSVTKAVMGNATGPVAILAISDGPGNYNFGTQPTGSVNSKTLTVTNTGGANATSLNGNGLAAPFTFAGGAYPGGGTCGVTLAAAGNCTIVVEYNPVVVSVSDTDSLLLDYNDGASAQQATRGLDGVAVSPALLSISDTDPYSFGTVAVGGAASHMFTITNGGGFQASAISESGIAAPYVYTGGSYPGTGGDCGATLNAGASCAIDVQYQPVGVSGADNDTLSVAYNDGVSIQSVGRDVTGIAVTPASLVISELDPYDYGLIASGGTSTHTFVVTNSGGSMATGLNEVGLAGPFGFLGGSYPGVGGDCGASLAATATCNLVIEFAPVAMALYSETLIISYNDGAAAQTASRGVQGTGAAPAVLTIVNGQPYDFGTQSTGGTYTVSLTVQNTGSVPATAIADGLGLASPFGFSGGSYPGSTGTCGAVLAAGASCFLEIQFSPSIQIVYNDTLDLYYDDGVTTQPLNFNITGTGGP